MPDIKGIAVKRVRFVAALGVLVGVASLAQAEERDFCADRPGKATPSCTLDTGHVQIEAGLFDYAYSRDSDTAESDYSSGNLLLVYGVNDSLEARVGWDGYGWTRSRDRMTGLVEHGQGAGDLTLSVRQNLRHPDDTGTAFNEPARLIDPKYRCEARGVDQCLLAEPFNGVFDPIEEKLRAEKVEEVLFDRFRDEWLEV